MTTSLIRQAVLNANVLVHGHFIFADGNHAATKLEMDHLWDNQESLTLVLDALAVAEDLPPPDVIIGVPSGGQCLALELNESGRISVPVAHLERVPGGKKQDFRFVTPADEALAIKAESVRIYEDVVTTLSSVAGVVRLLNPSKQEIHSLAIWRRGKVKPPYRQGVVDHYLVEEEMLSVSPDACSCVKG